MFSIKYLKSLLYIFISILIFSLLITMMNYFNIMNTNTSNHLKLLSVILSMLIGGIYIGKCSSNKGYVEGLKIGLITIVLLLLLSYLGFNKSFSISDLIYYLILIIASILGSIIGINKKSKS